MGGNELEVLKHYNRKIEKYRNDVDVLLNCLAKLEKVRVSISLLQDTNIGRTVSGLKKQYGETEVGERARDLVLKWKAVVAKEEREREEEDQEEEDPELEEPHAEADAAPEPPVYIPTPIVPEYVPTPIDQLRIKSEPPAFDTYHHQTMHSSGADTDDQEPEPPATPHHHHHHSVKKEKREDSDKERREKKHKHRDKERSEEDRKERKGSGHKSKKSHRDRDNERESSHRHGTSHVEQPDSGVKIKAEVDGMASSSSSCKEHKRSKSSSHHGDNKSKTATTHCDDIRDKSSRTKEESAASSSSGNRKIKAEPPDLPEESLGWDRRNVKVEKGVAVQEHPVRLKEEPAPVRVKSEPGENGHVPRHKDKQRDRHKDKDRDKKREKDKEKKKKIKVEPSVEEDLFARAMSGLAEMNDDDEEEEEAAPKKRPRTAESKSEERPGKEGRPSGARENGLKASSSSSRTDFEKFRIPSPPRSLPGPCFTPSASFMPEISPLYKPLPRPPMESRHGQSEEEALDYLMGQKNKNRSAVYSGKKRMRYFQEVPSLFDQCIMVLQDHVEDIDEVGDLNYSVLRPVLERAPPKTLMHIEDANPHLMEDTSELWEKHCNKDFRNKQREEMESWREMYERCTAEREQKLDQLKGKVKKTYLLEETSRRQTKIAYPDMVAKPPRDIARKQARFGTGLPVGQAMRVEPGGGGGSGVKPRVMDPTAGARAAPPSRKPKQPPMMAKVKNMMKGLKGVGFGRR